MALEILICIKARRVNMEIFLISNLNPNLYEGQHNGGFSPPDDSRKFKMGSFQVSSFMYNDLVIEDTSMHIYGPVVELSHSSMEYSQWQGSMSTVMMYGRRSLVPSL